MKYSILVPSFNLSASADSCHLFKKLNNSYILDILYELYQKAIGDKFDFYIVINSEQKIPISLKCYDSISIIRLKSSNSLLETLLKSKDSVCNNDRLIVNFGDTIVYQDLKKILNHEDEFSLVSKNGLKTELSGEYTYIKLDLDGCVESVLDKINLHSRSMRELCLFIGVFCIKNISRFWDCLKQNNSFISAYDDFCHQEQLKHLAVDNWYDVGHEIEYEEARVDVAARFFNEITIDKERGILHKTSKNKEKFINEINWYLKLPKSLAYIAPRIYEYSLDRDNPFINMELYGYKTLHEIYLSDCSSSIEIRKWGKIFDRLITQIKDMNMFKKEVGKKEYSLSLYEMYVNKTISRLNELKTNKMFERYFNEGVEINGISYPSLSEICEFLQCDFMDRYIANQNFSEKYYFSLIHGDLCFSNILVDSKLYFTRLIDPRGQFGAYDVFGDLNYDLAKLMHSFDGGYDFIIEDLFEIKQTEDNKILYSLKRDNKNNQTLMSLFFEKFEGFAKNINQLRLLESFLFLSMIPLHSDFPKRQLAMFATGVTLFSQSKVGA